MSFSTLPISEWSHMLEDLSWVVRCVCCSTLVILATCVLWAALGLLLVMWSAHTSNVDHGRIALGAGVIIGNGGVLATLIYAWYRAQRKN